MSRVVVTGMGIVSPIGNSIGDFENSIFNGISGAGLINRFNPCELPTRIGMQVKSFNADFRDVKISYALDAASQAMNQAFGNDVKDLPENTRLSIGIGLELFSMNDLVNLYNKNTNAHDLKSMTFLNTPSDICCHLISRKYGFSASPLIHISACAAGSDAIGSAYLQIKRKKSKVMLAGGTDSMINQMGIAGFCRIGAMTKKNETPLQASRPFDKDRDGFVIGEGAGFLVLEDEEYAKARGAKILGRISGYGNSLDAYSISDPHPMGHGAVSCMQRALKDANLDSSEIDAVSCHGTGTPKNDPAEATAIRTVFENEWQSMPVMATKSLTGHLISAAGAVEVIASLLSIKNNIIHKTLNLECVDVNCELDHVIGENRKKELNHIIKNSFGFGGQNASLIVSRYQ